MGSSQGSRTGQATLCFGRSPDRSFYSHGKLHPGHKTYLERLRYEAGYAVRYAGKWHMGLGTAAERGVQADLHRRLMAWMEAEGDELLHARHPLPVGSYIDGRSFDEQHDPGWSERDKAWFTQR